MLVSRQSNSGSENQKHEAKSIGRAMPAFFTIRHGLVLVCAHHPNWGYVLSKSLRPQGQWFLG
jgi:hypothetical protein